MADSPPTDLTARRAERARRNGALSRGPATARGKQRSSRNALRHGLTAKVHLVLHRDDEADFANLARGLGDELAPRGALEGFLVARLTAAMWHAGRSERMEARAFAAGADPDPDRLRLAMRYRGSVQRELFRCLGALQDLRRRPLELPAQCDEPAGHDNAGPVEADAGEAPAQASAASATPAADLARIAVAAWGGERTAAPPPGFLELRPVQNVWPIGWRFVQDRAFPGDVPLLVYADGTVRSPDGELLEDVWSPGGPLPPQPRIPAPPSPGPAPLSPAPAPLSPVPAPQPAAAAIAAPPAPVRSAPAPIPGPSPAVAAPLPEPEPSALDWLDGKADEFDAFDLLDDLPTIRKLRNEPTQHLDSASILPAPRVLDAGTSPPRIGLGRTPPDLSIVPSNADAVVEPQEPCCPISEPAERRDDHEPQAPALADKRAKMVAWERMWGIKLPESEFSGTCDDTSEAEAARPREQNCTNELPPCTPEPDTDAPGPPAAKANSDVEDRADPVRTDTVERLDDRHSDRLSSSTGEWRRNSSPRGRIRRRYRRALPAGSPE